MAHFNIFLSIAMALSFSGLKALAIEVVLNTTVDESIIIDIQPEDSFLNVIESIGQYFEPSHSLSLIEEKNPAQDNYSKAISMDLFFSNSSLLATATVHAKATSPRNYYALYSTDEKKDLSYILRTLSNNSLLKLPSYASSLKKAGDRIEHLHPLKFLQCIFTDDELIVCIRNIQNKGGWVWKDFLGGITGSLKKESSINNVKPEYVEDFAHQIGIDVNSIAPTIQEKNWEKLVKDLITSVPRKGDSNRYNMAHDTTQ
jgi:hypothetical protein